MIHSVLASEQRLGRVDFRPLCLSAVSQDCCLGCQPGLKHLLIHSQLHLHPARARVATSVQVVAVRCAGAEEVPYKGGGDTVTFNGSVVTTTCCDNAVSVGHRDVLTRVCTCSISRRYDQEAAVVVRRIVHSMFLCEPCRYVVFRCKMQCPT